MICDNRVLFLCITGLSAVLCPSRGTVCTLDGSFGHKEMRNHEEHHA